MDHNILHTTFFYDDYSVLFIYFSPVINVWTTGHNKRPRSQPFGTTDPVSQSHENKFGKAQTMSGHAGKYTPSESVPNLAHR